LILLCVYTISERLSSDFDDVVFKTINQQEKYNNERKDIPNRLKKSDIVIFLRRSGVIQNVRGSISNDLIRQAYNSFVNGNRYSHSRVLNKETYIFTEISDDQFLISRTHNKIFFKEILLNNIFLLSGTTLIFIFLILMAFFIKSDMFVFLSGKDIVFNVFYITFIVKNFIPLFKSGILGFFPFSVYFYLLFIMIIMGYMFFIKFSMQRYILLFFLGLRIFVSFFYDVSILISDGLRKNRMVVAELFFLMILLIFTIGEVKKHRQAGGSEKGKTGTAES
jgi:hypothetical protein